MSAKKEVVVRPKAERICELYEEFVRRAAVVLAEGDPRPEDIPSAVWEDILQTL